MFVKAMLSIRNEGDEPEIATCAGWQTKLSEAPPWIVNPVSRKKAFEFTESKGAAPPQFELPLGTLSINTVCPIPCPGA